MNDQNLDVSENLAENTLPESVDIQAQTQEKPFSKTIFGSIVLSTVFVIVCAFSVLILPNFYRKLLFQYRSSVLIRSKITKKPWLPIRQFWKKALQNSKSSLTILFLNRFT